MSAPISDAAASYIAKARQYIARASVLDTADEQHAYWLHFAVEPLLRAAAANAHPALLADPKSDNSLLVALGLLPEGTEFRSRGASSLLRILGGLDAHRFGPDFAQRANTFLTRRNAESHSALGVHASLRPGWHDDFLRITEAICDYIGLEVREVAGDAMAQLASRLSDQDEAAAAAEVARLIADARLRSTQPVKPSGFYEALYRDGHVTRATPCPVCTNEAYVSGWPITRSDPVIRGGNLERRITVATDSFECSHCGLQLPSRPLLIAAGLPDVFDTTEPVDPFEALEIDATEEIERMGLMVVEPDGRDWDD